MTKTWNRLLLVSVLLLMLVVVTPVAATTIRVDLNKTYEFKNTHLSTIKTLDLGDPSVSKVEIQTTKGDSSDVRVLQQPNILKITRVFTTDTGTFMGNTVTVLGEQTSTIDYTSRPVYRYYVNYTVPTFKVTVPGYTGNPMVVRYNDSWTKQDASLFKVANALYLYNGSGIGYTIGDNHFYSGGTFRDAPVNTNDLNYTLYNNRVSLNPYQADADTDFTFGDDTPVSLAGTGKYYAGALVQDEGTETATIYALSPVVVLKQETPLSWTDDYGTHSLPMTYVKGEMGDVTLKFASTSTTPTKIGYVFVNSAAQYNMQVKVNTTMLAEKTNDQWQTLSPSSDIIELMYDGIVNDIGTAYTYNITAVGQANAPEATSYSTIAISPGYGMSGNATASQITIPKETFSKLNDGVYYVYLMGINDDKNIVALAQSTVSVKSGAVPDPSSTAVTSIAPLTGTRNTTVSFTVMGTGFPTDFGTSGVNITLVKTGSPTITTTIASVTSTKITGTFDTGTAVNGARDVVLTTNDAGETIKTGAFTIVNSAQPAITKAVPTSAYRNTTVNFTLTGTGFETGTQGSGAPMTIVDFTNSTSRHLNTTILSVTGTSITGYVTLPADTPASAATTKWLINVTTVDGDRNKAGSPFTVNAWPTPAITAAAPITAPLNGNINFTLTGTGFQTDVNGKKMTMVDFTNATSRYVNTTILSVTSTKVIGYVFIPADTTTGAWKINVSTADGGRNKAGFAFTVTGNNLPSVTSANPTSAYLNQTINFTLKGTNFQSDLNNNKRTIVDFTNSTSRYLNTTLTSVNSTTIIGYVKIPADTTVSTATNKWKINVTTVDGGQNKAGFLFTITQRPAPAITTSTPASGYLNTTVNFTLKGTNFQTGGGKMTVVDFTNSTSRYLNATLLDVTSTTITGYVTLPYDAPASSTTTKWKVNVTTADGGQNKAGFAFTVSQRPAPSITSVSPTSGSKNTTVTFSINGNNFRTEPGYTNVSIVNQFNGQTIYGALTSVTSGKITGTMTIDALATGGSYDLMVTTVDGGPATKEGGFTVIYLPPPTITVLNPVSGFKNSSVAFTLTGTNFQVDNSTYVRLNSTAGAPIYATLTSVTPTKVTGTFDIPSTAAAGKYRLDVLTISGGSASKSNVFTINAAQKAVIASVTPTSSYRNRTFIVTVKGSNFQPNGGTNVTLSNPDTGGGVFNLSLISVTPTQLNGTVTIPAGAPTTPKWTLTVSTVDAGSTTKSAAITINSYPKPTFVSISPASDYQNQTVSFTVKGTNFQAGGTNMTFENKTSGQVLVPTLFSISPTQIVGSVVIPGPATAKAFYNVNITTVDGGFVTKDKAFAVTPLPKAQIISITPVKGQAGTTVAFTLNGKYFESKKGTSIRFENSTSATPVLNATISTVYSTRVTGFVTIPAGSTVGPWTVNVTTADAGSVTNAKIFSVF